MLAAISLYTGVGGLDFGFEAAGFRTAVAIEMDPVACHTIRLNRNWPVLEGDIHSFDSETILATAGLKVGEADVLIGGPPCQPYSKSSYWVSGDAARLDDPRSTTLTAYLRVLRDTQPRTFLLENVQGLAYKGKDEGLRYLIEGLNEVNRQAGTSYRVYWKVLNAGAFGVPQFRERVFLIGSRDGVSFDFPDCTHGDGKDGDLLSTAHEPYRTAWDALGDLPSNPNEPSLSIGGKWGELLPSIPEGQNYLWHTRRGGGVPLFGWRTRYWSFLLKLGKRQPSWTIQAQPGPAIGPFHWTNRKLTTHEMCRLQTFPDGLTFDCGRTDLQKMLGNAVPSLITEVLACSIRRQFFADERPPRALRLLPPRRVPVPAPEKVACVPPKYHGLVGNHADHPGEGLGVGARRRPQASNLSAHSGNKPFDNC
ncbi:MAG: DNA cytosine methyltransferase [Pseudomonadota bacterium]|nr:DNA cytosine methyltransferase [Pseudomonadota bacterium]